MKYEVHIIRKEDDVIVTTMEASSERNAERIQRGAEINLNHDLFYTEIEEVEDDEE